MPWLTRPAVAWFLALVMPFQVLTAVYLDMRGPAHFHVENGAGGRDHHDEHGRAPARDHHHAHDHVGGHGHTHGQARVERHHHYPGDVSVVAVHDRGLPEPLALREETTSGWSGTMLAALLASGASPLLPEMLSGLTPRPVFPLQTRFPGRLERPPRTSPA